MNYDDQNIFNLLKAHFFFEPQVFTTCNLHYMHPIELDRHQRNFNQSYKRYIHPATRPERKEWMTENNAKEMNQRRHMKNKNPVGYKKSNRDMIVEINRNWNKSRHLFREIKEFTERTHSTHHH